MKRSGTGGVCPPLAALALAGCFIDERSGCAWSEDELLREAAAGVVDEAVDCGIVIDGGDPALTRTYYDCLVSAPSDPGARLGVSHCIDCFAFTTYFSTPRGFFAIHQTAHTVFGDPPRSARVERCAPVSFERGLIGCVPDEELYVCTEE